MRMDIHLQQRLEQRMHLSQQMLQNLELLQLPIMDLRDLILKELEENPTLEERQDVEEREAPPVETAPLETAEETAKREILESVEDQWFESERRGRRSDSAEDAERRMEMLNNLSTESATLREHLTRQLAILEITPDLRALCEHVIQNIDDNGYLQASVPDMVPSLPEEIRKDSPEAQVLKLERALTVVQTLEPKGVGARSLKECLLLQLDENHPYAPLLRKLIENHVEDVGSNRLPKIVKALMANPEAMAFLGHPGEPDPEEVLEDVKVMIEEISRLNPKPGATFCSDRAPRVYPEVIIKQVDGKYEIVLEDGWLPVISVNRSYDDMIKEHRAAPEDREPLARISKDERLSAEERTLLAEVGRGRRITPQDRERLGAMAQGDRFGEEDRRLLARLSQERTLSRDEREFIKHKVDAGRKLITAIEQRRGTIYRITNELLKHQMDFFERGLEHLRPLKMQEVADAVGIHLSTVSRAISDKWVETPRGIFPLKFFFASAAPHGEAPSSPFSLAPALGTEPQDEGTRLALMERIREILESEDKKNPLSDLEIVRKLRDQHRVTAARRTIAKYREEMNIPSSRLRKQY